MDLNLIRRIVEAGVAAGVEMSGWQAAMLADAILEYSTDEYEITKVIWPELWSSSHEAREHVRISLRRELAIQLMEKNLIPVSAPHEEIIQPPRYAPLLSDGPYAGYVRVSLRVKVRAAPEFTFRVKRLGETRYVG